ncbi:MAG: aminotransferase class III-fold pyridoxal phosphate-dependent enzyme [Pseudomonadota bacterium]
MSLAQISEDVGAAHAFEAKAEEVIAGGVASLNRKVSPSRVFTKANGAMLWDIDGNQYVDFHAGFAPYILGHNCAAVNQAVIDAMESDWSLIGSGSVPWEVSLASTLTTIIPSMDQVQMCNTGSEATAQAIRLSRAWTKREDIVLILGGYNGNHDDVIRKSQPTLAEVGPRVSPGEYRFVSASAGIPETTKQRVHLINFNDLESLRYVFERNDIACVMLEPAMQNVGVILPQPDYLKGVKSLCEEYGAVCVFDEVKTGFRAALGGHQSICGVKPDLSVFGKAIANGYPMAVIGGRKDLMSYFHHHDQEKRVFSGGTYSAHPLNCAASLATINFLRDNSVHDVLEKRASYFCKTLDELFAKTGRPNVTVRNASAFCTFFMDHEPVDWHDVLEHHDFDFDKRYREACLESGIYHLPLVCKQSSISFAHSEQILNEVLDKTESVLKSL